MKNVCQCCILDLNYGVPVQVRDRVVAQALASQMGLPGGGGGAGGEAGAGSALALPSSLTAPLLGYTAGASQPTSDVNRQYAIMRAEAAEAANGGVVPYSGLASIAPQAHDALLRMGRTQPRYDRNQAKLCSFFARGECNRGAQCPYRHEMPSEKDEAMNKQNYKDRCVIGTEELAM